MTVIKLEHFGTYHLEYRRLVVIFIAQLEEIPRIRFNASFFEKVIAARSNDQEYVDEITRSVEAIPALI
jgi:hypothetical protein